jgi:hypothetical protein
MRRRLLAAPGGDAQVSDLLLETLMIVAVVRSGTRLISPSGGDRDHGGAERDDRCPAATVRQGVPVVHHYAGVMDQTPAGHRGDECRDEMNIGRRGAVIGISAARRQGFRSIRGHIVSDRLSDAPKVAERLHVPVSAEL